MPNNYYRSRNSEFVEACRRGDQEQVKKLLQRAINDNNFDDIYNGLIAASKLKKETQRRYIHDCIYTCTKPGSQYDAGATLAERHAGQRPNINRVYSQRRRRSHERTGCSSVKFVHNTTLIRSADFTLAPASYCEPGLSHQSSDAIDSRTAYIAFTLANFQGIRMKLQHNRHLHTFRHDSSYLLHARALHHMHNARKLFSDT